MASTLNLGRPQCFSIEEISSQISSHEEMDLNADLGDLLSTLVLDKLAIKDEIPECEGDTCIATLQRCIDTDSLVKTHKLATFREAAKKNTNFETEINLPLDFYYQNTHCFLVRVSPMLGLKDTCMTYSKCKSESPIGSTEIRVAYSGF